MDTHALICKMHDGYENAFSAIRGNAGCETLKPRKACVMERGITTTSTTTSEALDLARTWYETLKLARNVVWSDVMTINVSLTLW